MADTSSTMMDQSDEYQEFLDFCGGKHKNPETQPREFEYQVIMFLYLKERNGQGN